MRNDLSSKLLRVAKWQRNLFFKKWNALRSDPEIWEKPLEERLELILHVLPESPPYALKGPHRFVTLLQKEYPRLLLQLPQPPLGLFVWGAELTDEIKIGVVGSRKPTAYTQRMSREFSLIWGRLGFPIVSGGALGIDACAHEACLEAGGRTIAILGSGFNHLYPRSHQGLFRKILGNRGTLVSELAPEVAPRAHFFPERNRIIAAMSHLVFLAQAHERSGSLSTARAALDLGRDVSVLRPVAGDEAFAGSKALIEAGAPSIIEAGQIFEAGRRDISLPTHST